MPSNTIIERMVGTVVDDRIRMQIVVTLHDPKTGEQYVFRFDGRDLREVSHLRFTAKAITDVARRRLAKQWGSIYWGSIYG